MLRYTTDRPGLVAFYDNQPGNGAVLVYSYSPENQPGERQ